MKNIHINKKLAPIFATQLAAIPCADAAATVLNFVNSKYNYTTETDVHRWVGIGTEGGTVFDLVVYYTGYGTYLGPTAGDTGGKGTGYGRLGLPDGTNATFNFAFVDPNNGDAAVTIAELDWAILDIDHYHDDNNTSRFERVKFNLTDVSGTGSPQISLNHVGSDLTFEPNNFFDYVYESTVIANGENNPDNPLSLEDAQKKIALGFKMTDVSSFRMRFQNEGHEAGRNIFFTGQSNLVPEPSSTALLGLGLSGLLLRRHRA